MSIKEYLYSAILADLCQSTPTVTHRVQQMLAGAPDSLASQLWEQINQHKAPVDVGDMFNDLMPSLSTYTVKELYEMQLPDPVWIVEDYLPEGLAILAGKAKVGKSWLAMQLAHCVASGQPFLGKPVMQGACLYLALEDSRRRLQARAHAQGWAADLPVILYNLIDFRREIGALDERGADLLSLHALQHGCRLVVIDTLSRAMPMDQQDVTTVTAALTPLQEIAQRSACAVVLIDHHNKMSNFNPNVITDILGSTAKGAVADTAWGLYRQPGKREGMLGMTGRDIEEHSLAMAFDQESKSWLCSGESAQVEHTTREQEILETLSDLDMASLTEISKHTGQDISNTSRCIANLMLNGLVYKVRHPTKPHRYLFQLAAPDVEQQSLFPE